MIYPSMYIRKMSSQTYIKDDKEHLFEKSSLRMYSKDLEYIPDTFIYKGYYDSDGNFVKYETETEARVREVRENRWLVGISPDYCHSKEKDGKTYKQFKHPVYKSDLKTRVDDPYILISKINYTSEVP